MERNDIFKYVKEQYDTNPEYPWNKYPLYAVLRHKNNKKWYATIMNLPKEKLKIDSSEEVDVINLKCHSEIIGSLRQRNGFFPAYHMNKEHWITIILDGTVNNEEIKNFIDLSYELTI